MKLRLILPAFAVISGLALACAGGGGFQGHYNLQSTDLDMADSAMLAPGNDSRTNLLLLLADHRGISTSGYDYPDTSLDEDDNGPVFLNWRMMRAALTRAKPTDAQVESPPYEGTRCAGYAAGSAALQTAMAANATLPAGERTVLAKVRAEGEAVCKDATAWERVNSGKPVQPLPEQDHWPAVTSPAGREFLTYLRAAEAFYGDRFDQARAGFAALARASDPWLRETAAYMAVRVEFASAQTAATGEYGEFDVTKVDRSAVQRGTALLTAYLTAWSQGRYAGSARGLQRRALWLAGDQAALTRTYGRMIDEVPAEPRAAMALVEEIENKLPFKADRPVAEQPVLLLAFNDLRAMRASSEDGREAKPAITAEQLAAQAPRFSGHEDLFTFLQATHAYYYGHDYRRVVSLVPENPGEAARSNLGFSRQMLRGMALAALKDPGEGGFWQRLVGQPKGLWQRPLVELALAMHYERAGRLDAVFTPGSAITTEVLRDILIDHAADAALLRRIARNPGLAKDERDHALFTLQIKQLTRGLYGAFVADAAIPALLPLGTHQSNWFVTQPTAAVFTAGAVGDGSYGCARLIVSVRALAANPNDVPALLCVGEFLRLNNVGPGGYEPAAPDPDELGGAGPGFAGTAQGRAALYDKVLAIPGAPAEARAYALYRAVMCYAPSGYSECGGAEVPKARRKAWFQELKQRYPDSRWAKQLRYYW